MELPRTWPVVIGAVAFVIGGLLLAGLAAEFVTDDLHGQIPASSSPVASAPPTPTVPGITTSPSR